MTTEKLSLPLHVSRGKILARLTPFILAALFACAVLILLANGIKLYGLAAVLGLLICFKLLVAWFIIRPSTIILESDAVVETPLPFAWFNKGETVRHNLAIFDRVEAVRLDFLPGLVTVFIVILRGKEKKDDVVIRPPGRAIFNPNRAAQVGLFVKRLSDTYNLKAVTHA